MYVIQKDTGEFVTPPGSEHSYTRDLQKARIYPTRESADVCVENERVVAVEDLLDPMR